MRAKCNHDPSRRTVNTGRVHKDGRPVLICADCKSDYGRRYWRKKKGFQDWWDRQHGLCAFCGQPLRDDNTTCLDHNHVTGMKRGLVHTQCNLMIAGVENALRLVGSLQLFQYISKL